MSGISFSKETANLYAEYMGLIDQKSGCAQEICQVDAVNFQKLNEIYLKEINGVLQLHLAGVIQCAKLLKNGEFEKIDAVLGDHNCHVLALFSLVHSKDPSLKQEAEQLLTVAQEKKRSLQSLTSQKSKTPHQFFGENAFTLSTRMKYLVYGAILKVGTQCIKNPNGSFTRKIVPSVIQGNLSKTCPLPIIERLVKPLREYMNGCSIEIIQQVAASTISSEEGKCLAGDYARVGKTIHNETFRYPCAFYNVKASLLKIAKEGIPFVVVAFEQNRILSQAPLIFLPQQSTESSETYQMKLADKSSLKPEDPIFVIQCFFNKSLSVDQVGQQLEAYDLLKFMLAGIAVKPQFDDLKPEAYARDEDIEALPQERREEIKHYREEGKRLGLHTETPTLCRIEHTYASSYKYLKSNNKNS